MTVVLDTSALLTFLHDEPGADRVRASLDGAVVSAVNWSEVVQKSLWRHVDVHGMAEELAQVGVVFDPFTRAQAEVAARLWRETRGLGLSLADRACLALALERGAAVLTADRAWADLDLNIEVVMVRPP